jgi:hypothetical protein
MIKTMMMGDSIDADGLVMAVTNRGGTQGQAREWDAA